MGYTVEGMAGGAMSLGELEYLIAAAAGSWSVSYPSQSGLLSIEKAIIQGTP
jgi:hypothetical protein